MTAWPSRSAPVGVFYWPLPKPLRRRLSAAFQPLSTAFQPLFRSDNSAASSRFAAASRSGNSSALSRFSSASRPPLFTRFLPLNTASIPLRWVADLTFCRRFFPLWGAPSRLPTRQKAPTNVNNRPTPFPRFPPLNRRRTQIQACPLSAHRCGFDSPILANQNTKAARPRPII